MNQSANRLAVLAAVCVLGVASSGTAAAVVSADRALPSWQVHDPIDEADLTRAVEAAYRSLEHYSGGALSFRLGDFRTLRREDLGGLSIAELATLPSGRVIDVTRQVREDKYLGLATVEYRARWSTSTAEWAPADAPEDLRQVSVADAFQRASEGQPDLTRVRAVTLYSVDVTLDGESRGYRAAFVWTPADGGPRLKAFVLDHIVQAVEQAAGEHLAYAAASDARPVPGGGEATSNALCTAWSSTSGRTRELTGTNGHFSGDYHRSHAEYSATCACSASCVSTCDASIANESCTDKGWFTTDACHKLAQTIKATSDRVDDGPSAGAACAGGYGCIQKACLFCLCGLGIEVEIAKAKVSFTSSGDPEWQGNTEYSRTCGKCNPVREITVSSRGTTNIIPLSTADTYNPSRSMVYIASGLSTANARVTGQGHNQDTYGYARVMVVSVNGTAYTVISWLNNGETKAFDFTLPAGALTNGWNDIRAYIYWGTDEYNSGHWVYVDLVLP